MALRSTPSADTIAYRPETGKENLECGIRLHARMAMYRVDRPAVCRAVEDANPIVTKEISMFAFLNKLLGNRRASETRTLGGSNAKLFASAVQWCLPVRGQCLPRCCTRLTSSGAGMSPRSTKIRRTASSRLILSFAIILPSVLTLSKKD
jgi:hypothetical protein